MKKNMQLKTVLTSVMICGMIFYMQAELVSVSGQEVEKNVVVPPDEPGQSVAPPEAPTPPTMPAFDIEADTAKVLGDRPEVKKSGDTTRIQLGKKGITIVEKDGKTIVDIQDVDKDSTKKNESEWYDESKPNKKDRHTFEPHWAGFELTLNNFATSSFSLSLPASASFLELNTGKSIGVRLNLFEYSIPFSSFNGLYTGMGFEFNSYYFSSDSNNITKSNGQIVPKYKPTGSSAYSKNKLKDTYLNIPLMYEIQFPLGNTKHPLYFAAGVIGGLKLGSRTKEYYKLNGETRHEIVKNDFYLSPIRLGYQARIGFRHIHLVATYYQTPLFISGKGPEIHPFDIGLMILNW
ncbi:MAG TPA: outer membrane beta-barrel protein [Bacteroidales bacterium]|nr:outer membrane beta-barrel protein [Bacteroidales bacterium]HOK98928.1 outer membrane beta-barrel protein [Bacteroidales bacterium]HPO66407.1 outer membrane beta-barrel protein [Bacteroidales bacterium]